MRRPFVLMLLLAALVSLACTPAPPPAKPPAPAPVVPPMAAADLSLLPRSAEIPEWTPVLRRMRSVPMRLTASDGTALKLIEVDARTLVEDPLAFTEVKLRFENPTSRRIEGRFDITLPAGAAISRFAMRIGDGWQEGEVVERGKGQRAYEDFLHQRIDPALLEHAGGNRFSARVFPIERRADKELIIAYSQVLEPGVDPVLVPLAGLSKVDRVEASLSAVGAAEPSQFLSRIDYAPEGDFGLDARLRKPSGGLRSSDMALVRVRPPLEDQRDVRKDLFFLVDTSASRAADFDAQLALLTETLRVLAADDRERRVAVGCFDQTQEIVFAGRAGEFDASAIASIKERGALGASDLPAALRWAAAEAKARSLGRLVLIGDGMTTAGGVAADAVTNAAGHLTVNGVKRVDAIAVGGLRDDDALRQLVRALPVGGVVIDGDASAATILRRLTHRAQTVTVELAGATWSHPKRVEGVQAGDEIIVHARLPAAAPVALTVNGQPLASAPLRNVNDTLLGRSMAGAEIRALLDRAAREGDSDAISERIVELSTEARVLSPLTSLVVLETEADYEAWSIDRNALADILTVEGSRLAVVERSPLPPASNARPARPPTSEGKLSKVRIPKYRPKPPRWVRDAGSSGLHPGLRGIGEGGGGRGEGIGLGSVGTIGHGAGVGTGQGFGGAGQRRPSRRVPRVRTGKAQVHGQLPPAVIRRIVRQNFGRFRLCYENGLRQNPTLQGRVVVKFVIGRTGKVTTVSGGGDIPDQGVVSCVARAFYGLTFPQPQGGIVTVSYPIVFTPGKVRPRPSSPLRPPPPTIPKPAPGTPLKGPLAEVQKLIDAGKSREAVARARAWRASAPGDLLAQVGLGRAHRANRDDSRAARAYGSVIDLFPARADLRRYAGNLLQTLSSKEALRLALDSYRAATAQRPDHPSGHRMQAMLELELGDHERAFATLEAGLSRSYPERRHRGVGTVLGEDLGLVAAAWIAAAPDQRASIEARLKEAGAKLATEPSLRFVLTWETDANDVDLHVFDGRGRATPHDPAALKSGSIYANVATGYGPEIFAATGSPFKRPRSYHLQAYYARQGAMGYGMGMVQIVRHDGRGAVTFEERPFVALSAGALVDIGEVRGR